MLACVDGTGPSSSEDYARVFRSSFVNRIKNHCAHSSPIYHRGPGSDFSDGVVGTFGGSNHVSPQYVFDEIMTRFDEITRETDAIEYPFGRRTPHEMTVEEQARIRELQEQQKIYLAGYSRGGAIVIAVVQLLEDRGLPVEAMFLFDAVNRSFALADTQTIPANVRYCYHAMRNIGESGSRESFGHCGRRAATGVSFIKKHFFTTHGGMGGTPWGSAGLRVTTRVDRRSASELTTTSRFIDEGGTDSLTRVTPLQETAGMNQVEAWMWPKMRHHRIITG